MGYIPFLRDNAHWLTVGFLLTFTSGYGQTYFISIFAAEIMQTFGLTHGQWGLTYTLGTAASALVMVWAGALTDRLRVRTLAPATFAMLAASCVFMALNPVAILLPAVIFCLRFSGQGMASHIAGVAMSRWFATNRGRALAAASLGFAVSQTLLPIAFVAAKPALDWRALWLVAALLALAAIPPLIPLLRHERTPQSIAASVVALGMNGRHWRRADMLRHPLFWLLVPAILGPAAWNTALFFQQVHLAEVKGWQHGDFVAMLPLFTAVSVAATFASGWAIDRFGAGPIMALQGIPLVAGYAIFWASDDLGHAMLAMSCIALATGSMATLPGSFAAEYFGTRHIGSIKSVWAALMVFGSAIGPGITGWLIDLGWTFSDQSLAIACYFALSSVSVILGILRARGTLSAAA